MSYEEFWQSVIEAQYGKGRNVPELRLGQRFYNMLPREIADVIVGTTLDPYYHDYVTPEMHEFVQRLWERASGAVTR